MDKESALIQFLKSGIRSFLGRKYLSDESQVIKVTSMVGESDRSRLLDDFLCDCGLPCTRTAYDKHRNGFGVPIEVYKRSRQV